MCYERLSWLRCREDEGKDYNDGIEEGVKNSAQPDSYSHSFQRLEEMHV